MNKEQLNYLCETYGDKSLNNDEKWKSIVYFATPTSLTPMFSVQDLLKNNQIRYSEKCAEPGFFIIDYQSFEYGVFNTEDGLLITFIPLSKIASITVTPKITYKNNDSDTPDKPQEPDAVVDALTSLDDTANYIIDMNGGADESEEFEIVYDGLGANTVDTTK